MTLGDAAICKIENDGNYELIVKFNPILSNWLPIFSHPRSLRSEDIKRGNGEIRKVTLRLMDSIHFAQSKEIPLLNASMPDRSPLLGKRRHRLLIHPKISHHLPLTSFPSHRLAQELSPNIDDVELMKLASGQDSAALAELYDRHSPLLYSVLMQKLADPADSQDILHDVFLKLYHKASSYNPALGRPIAWLLTMARNAAIDKLRKRGSHQRYVAKAVHEVEPHAPAHAGPHSDELALLNHCVEILPEEQRQTLHLAYFGGLTQQEISDQLSQPLGTVKARIRRGLLKLRDCVEGNQ